MDSVADWDAEDGTKVRTFKGRARDYKQGARSNQEYNIEIDWYGRPFSKKSGVFVLCNCAYFFYHCAWWLWKKDATDPDTGFGLGDVGWKPKAVTPQVVSAMACKHIIRALTANLHKLPPGKSRGREVARR